MNDLRLRHVPGTRSTRILWLLEEVGCDYHLEIVGKNGPCGRRPVARVPALRDDDVLIHETGAMTEWICETRAPQLWRSPGSDGRAGWLDWLHFGETLAVAAQFRVTPRTALSASFGEVVELEPALGLLADWLDGSEWLMSSFSGVDCHVGYSVLMAAEVADLARHPVLQAYLARCRARPAFARAKALGT